MDVPLQAWSMVMTTTIRHSVSILVLMDVPLQAGKGDDRNCQKTVSILVLMDVPLQETKRLFRDHKESVSILVLMDVRLQGEEKDPTYQMFMFQSLF